MSNANAVVAAINGTKLAEVVKVTEGKTRLQIVHRVKDKKLRPWLGVMEYVLSRKTGWDAHVCKHYFLKAGKLVYGWNFIVQWKNPEDKDEILSQVKSLLTNGGRNVPNLVHQLESYPLAGAKANRNEPATGMDPRAPGPMRGGLSQKGAHRL